MPIIRSQHLAREQAERKMAKLSATNVERIIHNNLADLHSAAADGRPSEALSREVAV
jgi:hypothetical protein